MHPTELERCRLSLERRRHLTGLVPRTTPPPSAFDRQQRPLAPRHQVPPFPHRVSRTLAWCCTRSSDDRQAAYGRPILAVESFVDAQLFRGTARKSTDWRSLCPIAGFTRVSEDLYVAHDRPKTLYMRLRQKRAAGERNCPKSC